MLISEISVSQLFGRYNYHLKLPRNEDGKVSNISMVYGDNGTGKTTIMKLLFHALSPAPKSGHRGYIAKTPFSAFSVAFSDGSLVKAVRANGLTGPFNFSVKRPGRRIATTKVVVSEDFGVPDRQPPEYKDVLREVANLGLSVFFLSDERVLESDKFVDEERQMYDQHISDDMLVRVRSGLHRHEETVNRNTLLRKSFESTSTWLRRTMIKESSRGESDAQQIYANIVDKLNQLGVPKAQSYDTETRTLMTDLESLSKRSDSFAEFGLASRLNIEPLLHGIRDTSPDSFAFVAQVAKSFIDGQTARLEALEDLRRTLSRFEQLVNEFLVDKRVVLEVNKGISILSDYGSTIRPEDLSSGEKQLLLLFCNVMVSSEAASLFVIDEPEISLNVKWQRQLVGALTDITQNAQCQFLLATHSIELLTMHRDKVMKLIRI
jgi:energy-coupling factor transporter ATP-binding protein EcfA2